MQSSILRCLITCLLAFSGKAAFGQSHRLFQPNFLILPLFLPAQPPEKIFIARIQPVFQGKHIVLNEPIRTPSGDTLVFHVLKFYLGRFDFLKKDSVVFQDLGYRLLDLETENAFMLYFNLPENVDFDGLRFDLGTDSLTNVSGAMAGDLDPTRGMFWSWQSGYINVKIEGVFSRSPAKNGEFQFHLGGYLSPFQTVHQVILPVSAKQNLQGHFELAPFFEKIDWTKKHSIMSPGAAAAQCSKVLSASFSVHAE